MMHITRTDARRHIHACAYTCAYTYIPMYMCTSTAQLSSRKGVLAVGGEEAISVAEASHAKRGRPRRNAAEWARLLGLIKNQKNNDNNNNNS